MQKLPKMHGITGTQDAFSTVRDILSDRIRKKRIWSTAPEKEASRIEGKYSQIRELIPPALIQTAPVV